MRKIIFAVLVVVFALFMANGCAKLKAPTLPNVAAETPTYMATVQPTAGSGIYVSGAFYDGTTTVPCYWIGNTRVPLSYAGVSGAAVDLTVSGGKIYISGMCFSGSSITGCYWVDGVRTDIPSLYLGDVCTNIAVDGTDVYIGGMSLAATGWQPGYWKNTVQTIVPVPTITGGNTMAGSTSMYYTPGTVYIAGEYVNNTTTMSWIPCYWANSARTDLPYTGFMVAAATGIFVQGGNIYTSGSYVSNTMVNTPCYWTNTTMTTLPFSGTGAGADCIFVSGGTVYTAGYYTTAAGNTSCFWTGTLQTDLPNSFMAGTDKYATGSNSLRVYGGQVYNAGLYMGGSGYTVACYWQGTVKIDLPGGPGESAASSIFIQ